MESIFQNFDAKSLLGVYLKAADSFAGIIKTLAFKAAFFFLVIGIAALGLYLQFADIEHIAIIRETLLLILVLPCLGLIASSIFIDHKSKITRFLRSLITLLDPKVFIDGSEQMKISNLYPTDSPPPRNDLDV